MAVFTHVQATNFDGQGRNCAQGWVQAGLAALWEWVQHWLQRSLAIDGVGTRFGTASPGGGLKEVPSSSRYHCCADRSPCIGLHAALQDSGLLEQHSGLQQPELQHPPGADL